MAKRTFAGSIGLELNQYSCIQCNSSENLTIDHIIPVSKGGMNHICNYQILCKECNLEKSNKILDEPIDCVKYEDLIEIIDRRTRLPRIYVKAVIKSAVPKISQSDFVFNLSDSFKLLEYCDSFGLDIAPYNLKPKHRFVIKRCPKNSKFVAKFDPTYVLPDDANETFANYLLFKICQK